MAQRPTLPSKKEKTVKTPKLKNALLEFFKWPGHSIYVRSFVWTLHCHCIFFFCFFCSVTIFVAFYYHMWWIKIFIIRLSTDEASHTFKLLGNSAPTGHWYLAPVLKRQHSRSMWLTVAPISNPHCISQSKIINVWYLYNASLRCLDVSGWRSGNTVNHITNTINLYEMKHNNNNNINNKITWQFTQSGGSHYNGT